MAAVIAPCSLSTEAGLLAPCRVLRARKEQDGGSSYQALRDGV